MTTITNAASHPTSLSLLGRATSGDASAWQKLVQLYGPLVYTWIRRLGLQAADAADATQETFAAVATRLPTFDHGRVGGTFRGWLWTIARNKAADQLRRQHKQVIARGGSTNLQLLQAVNDDQFSVHIDASSQGEPVTSEALDKQEIVRRALAIMRTSFEASTWQAFWLTVVEGRTPDEAAAELSLSRWAVYKARSRVLHCLRIELAGLEELE